MSSSEAVVAGRAHLMVTQSATILRRLYFLERELVRLAAGWLPGTAHWEAKLLLPEVMWESSLLTRELRQRILELRYPERRIAPDVDEPWVQLFRRCGDAPGAPAFLVAVAEVVKPALLVAYRRYQEVADRLDDGPTQYLLRHGIADLEAQVVRLRAAAAAALAAAPGEAAAARAWSKAVAAVFGAISADDLLQAPAPPSADALVAAGRPLAISRHAARDPRFHRVAFAWPDRHTPGHPGEGIRLRARQAVHHVNEVWAAEMAAACLYDLAPAAPPEFLEEAARWCYDEIRHCRMGYERLRTWGFSDAEIPLDAFSYDAGAAADPLVRLGIIFYFEATYIHTKKERTIIFGAMGDRLSAHDMDFDWADELIHTHYGKRWLEAFLAQSGDARSVADIKEEARQAVLRLQARATPEDQAAAATIQARILLRMATLAPDGGEALP
ncbi:MAG: DUF455 family protein [Opitutaceae bacterium]|nr:DUF455 family protein [Opitutaceae bacterium]